MPLMSRFRKDKKDDAEADETPAELEEDKDAGLFMANSSQPDQPAAKGAQAEADDLLEASSGETASPDAGSDEQPDDSASGTPVPTTEDEADSSESPRPSTAEETTPTADPIVKTVPASEGATDDLMSAFRTGGDEVKASGLTEQIEDVPIDELLADMREIMELLGLTVPAVDTSEELQDAV